MKKTVNLSGIIFLLVFITGVIFKRMHIPGAGPLTILGIFTFLTIYLPLFIVALNRQMKNEGIKLSPVIIWFGFLSILIFAFGILSKIMHWPGTNISILGGIIAFILFLLLFLVVNLRSLNQKVSIMPVLIVIFILGSFFYEMFWIGNIRPMWEGYVITGESVSESSRIFWGECEEIITTRVLPDSASLEPEVREKLIKLHSLVQSTDLVLGKIIEDLKTKEITISESRDQWKATHRAEMVRMLENEGLPLLYSHLSDYRKCVSEMKGLFEKLKTELIDGMNPALNPDSEMLLGKNYVSIDYPASEPVTSLLLWKSRIWETEYTILTEVLKN